MTTFGFRANKIRSIPCIRYEILEGGREFLTARSKGVKYLGQRLTSHTPGCAYCMTTFHEVYVVEIVRESEDSKIESEMKC